MWCKLFKIRRLIFHVGDPKHDAVKIIEFVSWDMHTMRASLPSLCACCSELCNPHISSEYLNILKLA